MWFILHRNYHIVPPYYVLRTLRKSITRYLLSRFYAARYFTITPLPIRIYLCVPVWWPLLNTASISNPLPFRWTTNWRSRHRQIHNSWKLSKHILILEPLLSLKKCIHLHVFFLLPHLFNIHSITLLILSEIVSRY